jgi:hypothetical protein
MATTKKSSIIKDAPFETNALGCTIEHRVVPDQKKEYPLNGTLVDATTDCFLQPTTCISSFTCVTITSCLEPTKLELSTTFIPESRNVSLQTLQRTVFRKFCTFQLSNRRSALICDLYPNDGARFLYPDEQNAREDV